MIVQNVFFLPKFIVKKLGILVVVPKVEPCESRIQCRNIFQIDVRIW
jgi:hypothetical protein